MKRILIAFLTLTLAFGLASSAFAAKKKKRSPGLPKQTIEHRSKKPPKGNDGLGAQKNSGQPTKKEVVKFKKFNENDPARVDDNTISVVRNGEEVEMPVKETWNERHLRFFEGQQVSIMSSYNPETGSYTVTGIQPFSPQY